MCHNRILGNHVVRSTVSTLYVWPQFTVDPPGREKRPPEHLANCPKYPDSEYWLNEVQHYFFRNTQLRHLRVAQFVRYFARKLEKRGANSRKVRTDENTIDEDVEGVAEDDNCHRNFDAWSSGKRLGKSCGALLI